MPTPGTNAMKMGTNPMLPLFLPAHPIVFLLLFCVVPPLPYKDMMNSINL